MNKIILLALLALPLAGWLAGLRLPAQVTRPEYHTAMALSSSAMMVASANQQKIAPVI